MQVDETSRERILGEGQAGRDCFSSQQAREGTSRQACNCIIAFLYRIISFVVIARSTSPVPPDSNDNKTPPPQNTPPDLQGQQAVVQRSRWQAVLLEAGGISAAVSEESMRRLKYCLQWLQVCPSFFLQISFTCDFPPVRHTAH
jgi:hypothetical protein